MLPRVSAIHLCISTASVVASLDLAEVGHAQLAVHQAFESSLERYVVSESFCARLRGVSHTDKRRLDQMSLERLLRVILSSTLGHSSETHLLPDRELQVVLRVLHRRVGDRTRLLVVRMIS